MANSKKQRASELTGFNIYQDPKKGTVYYDFITKAGYIITTSDVPKIALDSLGFPLGVLVYFIVSFFSTNQPLAIGLGVVFYILGKLFFRFTVLYKLPKIENYKVPQKKNIYEKSLMTYSRTQAVILTILSSVLVITIIAYMFLTKLDTLYFIGYLVMLMGAIFVLSIGIYVLKNTSKNKNH